MSNPTRLTVRVRSYNGLPVETTACMVAVLERARRTPRGTYVQQWCVRLARNLAEGGWGGCWWGALHFRMPGPCRAPRPKGAELS